MELALMHVVLKTNKDEDYNEFCAMSKELLNQGAKEISISPMRDAGKQGEIYVTLQIEMDSVRQLLDYMSDGWDGDEYDCVCYYFTSKIYCPHIDTLYFSIPD